MSGGHAGPGIGTVATAAAAAALSSAVGGASTAIAATAAAAPGGGTASKPTAALSVGRVALAAIVNTLGPLRFSFWRMLRGWFGAFVRQLESSDYLAGILAMSAMGVARDLVARVGAALFKWVVRRLWATIRLEEKEAELLRAWLRERPELHASAELALYSHRDSKVGHAHLYEYEPEIELTTRLRVETRNGFRWIWVTYHTDKTAVVCVLGRDKGALEEILELGRAIQKKRRERYLNVVQVYTSKSGHGIRWLHPQDRVGRQLGRPISSVILPRCTLTGLDQATALLNDVREFLESEWWYCERGIPYRRGYLLHGVPGSGKSSLIMALAHEMQLPIYMLQLSSEQMTDDTLNSLLQYGMHDPPTILLLEDVDLIHSAVLHRRKQRGGGLGLSDAEDEQEAEQAESDTEQDRRGGKRRGGRLTLSGLLNALDGPTATVGRLLFMTTNARDRLDPALLRSGRIDYELRFGDSDADQIQRLFVRFYSDAGRRPNTVSGTGVATADIASAVALGDGDAGGTSPAETNGLLHLEAPASAEARGKPKPASCTGKAVHDIQALATSFAERVIGSSVRATTADIQRHLMHHKRNPERALKELHTFLHTINGGGDFDTKPDKAVEAGAAPTESDPAHAAGPVPETGCADTVDQDGASQDPSARVAETGVNDSSISPAAEGAAADRGGSGSKACSSTTQGHTGDSSGSNTCSGATPGGTGDASARPAHTDEGNGGAGGGDVRDVVCTSGDAVQHRDPAESPSTALASEARDPTQAPEPPRRAPPRRAAPARRVATLARAMCAC